MPRRLKLKMNRKGERKGNGIDGHVLMGSPKFYTGKGMFVGLAPKWGCNARNPMLTFVITFCVICTKSSYGFNYHVMIVTYCA